MATIVTAVSPLEEGQLRLCGLYTLDTDATDDEIAEVLGRVSEAPIDRAKARGEVARVLTEAGRPDAAERVYTALGGPLVRSLAQIIADPTALDPPQPVVPYLAWAGRVTLLAGREKLGKSTVAGAGAAAVSSGALFVGSSCTPGPVLWVGLEEHTGDLARRMVEFGADVDRLYVVDALRRPQADLAEAVQATRAVLVVIDTLAAFAEAMGLTDAGSAAAWAPIMAGLTRVARETGAAVLLLHHARKSDGAYRDSTAVAAGVDAVLELHPADEANTRKLKGKARWQVTDCTMRLEGNHYTLTDGELPLKERVQQFVQANPACSMRALRKGVTGNNQAIDDALKELLDSGAVEDRGTGNGSKFYINGGAPDQAHSATEGVPTQNPAGTRLGTVPGHASHGERAQTRNPIVPPVGTPPQPLPEDPELWEQL